MASVKQENTSPGWIGVDLDGTLAHYEGWQGATHVGEPIEPMLLRVQHWLSQGKDVRIFTARVANPADSTMVAQDVLASRFAIEAWCLHHLGKVLPITCCKDFGMVELWDDRCVQVETNTGMVITGEVDLLS